jgi:predicted dinucleotide-binding enzyme
MKETAVKIGFLGTGNLAVTLGSAWSRAGHSVVVTGRDREHADRAAAQIDTTAAPVDPRKLADLVDVVVVAIPWSGLESALTLVGAPAGALAGKTVIDCTNPVDYGTGRLLPAAASAAELVARLAPGAHVVKALHLFAGASWPFTGDRDLSPVVALCGDDPNALSQTAALITDLGGRVVVVGGLDAARQAEEAAGFVMRVVAAGANPRFAVPDVSR